MRVLGHERPVEVVVQFGWPRPRPPSLNGRSSVSRSQVALPPRGQRRPHKTQGEWPFPGGWPDDRRSDSIDSDAMDRALAWQREVHTSSGIRLALLHEVATGWCIFSSRCGN